MCLKLEKIVVMFLDQHCVLHRAELIGKAKYDTPYLIVSDHEGDPLWSSRHYALFVEIKAQPGSLLSENSSPHSLRHTFPAVMERALAAAGLEEERRARALALLRGDSGLKSHNACDTEWNKRCSHPRRTPRPGVDQAACDRDVIKDRNAASNKTAALAMKVAW